MNDLGRYFIRVMNNDRIYIRSNTTGRFSNLGSISEIPNFIKADVLNEVFIPMAKSKTQFELKFGESLNDYLDNKGSNND